MSNKEYDKQLQQLYIECKNEYPHIPDIALLIECQRYLKNPNNRTNKHQKGIISKMKKNKELIQQHENKIEEEKAKWLDNNTFIGVSFENTSNIVIEDSNIVIEDLPDTSNMN